MGMLCNCVDKSEGRFIGMKSHNCNVMMQRILSFVFSGLSPQNVHQAFADIFYITYTISRHFKLIGITYIY